MTVADALDRISVAEFHDWQLYFEYRNQLSELGERGMKAIRDDIMGTTDHDAIARDMMAAFGSIGKKG